MHARLSTVCNYEITLDPLYASIIIAFYAGARETTTNFSVAREPQPRKVVHHFSPIHGGETCFRMSRGWQAIVIVRSLVKCLFSLSNFPSHAATFLSLSPFFLFFFLFLSLLLPSRIFNEIFSFSCASICASRIPSGGERRDKAIPAESIWENFLQFYTRVTHELRE